MLFNRQSGKNTSRISLAVAVVMLTTVFFAIQSQGYQVNDLAENSVHMCKVGTVELFLSLLW